MRYWLAHFGLIGMSVAFLVHFSMLVKYQELTIREPNPYILWAEIALLTFFLTLGIMNTVAMAKREGKWHDRPHRHNGSNPARLLLPP